MFKNYRWWNWWKEERSLISRKSSCENFEYEETEKPEEDRKEQIIDEDEEKRGSIVVLLPLDL